MMFKNKINDEYIGNSIMRKSPTDFNSRTFYPSTLDSNDVSLKEEHLEISLCGNNTALFVRETSTECLKTPQGELEDESDDFHDDSITIDRSNIGKESDFSVKSRKSGAVETTENERMQSSQFQAIYTKKWSGKTYLEEELRKLRNKKYDREVKEALEKRKLWKQFEKDILKERKRDLLRHSGPGWWQEPSRRQIQLATSLGDVIKADHEEGVTGRTRQWLLDLGITQQLSPKEVKRCMKRSLLDPIDFLLEAHSIISNSQTKNNKKKGSIHSPFSINERILLSAMCVLQLPTMLTILHYILPPPKRYPKSKHIQKILFGDLEDESIRYSTPYMEPLPFRDQRQFHDWAFDRVYRALLPSLMSENLRQEQLDGMSAITKSTLKLSDFSRTSERRRTPQRFSDFSASPSVAWLISHVISKRRVTDSLYTLVDEESRRRSYSRCLAAKLQQSKKHQDSLSFNEDAYLTKERFDSPSHSVEKPESLLKPSILENITDQPSALHDQPTSLIRNTITKEFYDAGNREEFTILQDREAVVYDNLDTDNFQPALEEQIQSSSQVIPGETVAKAVLIKTEDASRKSLGGIVLSETKDESKKTLAKNNPALKNLWNEIKAFPKKQHLHQAIKVLAGAGDPLAQLPGVHKLVSLQRWLELREGKNRVLSRDTKDDLLKRSRAMWKLASVASSMKGPKLSISKRKERMLTWNSKNWLESEINKEKAKYFQKIKQEKVNNARSFFPSMLNTYDHGSKLNRNFRDIYFTYLPSREADTLAYRPWKPEETK